MNMRNKLRRILLWVGLALDVIAAPLVLLDCYITLAPGLRWFTIGVLLVALFCSLVRLTLCLRGGNNG